MGVTALHAAMAVLLVHAMRGTRLLPPFVILNVGMLISTPVDGAHYLVDVLAGATLAFALIALDRRRSARPHSTTSTVPRCGLESTHP